MLSGPKIIADSLSARGTTSRSGASGGHRRGRFGRQYNSRDGHHSLVTAWSVLFDLLRQAETGPGSPRKLWKDIARGRLGFRMNHVVAGSGASKALDLVVCEVGANTRPGAHFADLADRLEIELRSPSDRRYLKHLGSVPFHELPPDHIANVRVAIEAKAAMNSLQKAIPRLYAEIVATGVITRDAQDARRWKGTVVANLTLVNTALKFFSSTRGTAERNRSTEADAVVEMLEDIRKGLISHAYHGRDVFDALGAVLVSCENDNRSPVRLVRRTSTGRRVKQKTSYDQMLADMCAKL